MRFGFDAGFLYCPAGKATAIRERTWTGTKEVQAVQERPVWNVTRRHDTTRERKLRSMSSYRKINNYISGGGRLALPFMNGGNKTKRCKGRCQGERPWTSCQDAIELPQHVAATFFKKILIDFDSWMPRRACFQVYLCVSCCAVFSTSRGNVHAEESSPPRPPPPPPPGDHADWPEAFDESELGTHYSPQRTQIKFKQISEHILERRISTKKIAVYGFYLPTVKFSDSVIYL